MLQNLEKEIDDVDAKIGDRWRLLDRFVLALRPWSLIFYGATKVVYGIKFSFKGFDALEPRLFDLVLFTPQFYRYWLTLLNLFIVKCVFMMLLHKFS